MVTETEEVKGKDWNKGGIKKRECRNRNIVFKYRSWWRKYVFVCDRQMLLVPLKTGNVERKKKGK